MTLIAATGFAWIAIVSIVATTKGGIPFYRFPSSYLGAATAGLALLGRLQQPAGAA